jgi:hypothetical protein
VVGWVSMGFPNGFKSFGSLALPNNEDEDEYD